MAALRTALSTRIGSQASLTVRTKALRAPRLVAARVGRVQRVVAASVDKEQVLTDVRSIIAEQLGTDLDKVAADSKFVDLGADSLDTVEIMMALEEKFDITLDEENAEKISTVGEAAEMISQQMS
uniref:Acyl carrier protein n=1 Tax=Tetraselmis sp. GSL018 TaxID=582737 RepID=A0A061SJK5_9CHLO|mmetsp:Transcript_16983/g.40519  ORF Transcript_16983/g.40519 Transcript_16983/m.40519 type:complete len:125 (+) Transcript_16983:118-492(+)|eukprot:CAMPEP_0177584446 /NCGR_PEP_ID=MMETSP0419_2-20121207/3899_1 /TAXON_ID=582737 /ORGANISM="Tetraselmis sp., Strain GSL018" /LENGTH=124 /DNA_ID=CAMNT_0019073983 /DNA_START=100 /DNA_END=474 /DNA_ORIENTATION=-